MIDWEGQVRLADSSLVLRMRVILPAADIARTALCKWKQIRAPHLGEEAPCSFEAVLEGNTPKSNLTGIVSEETDLG